MPKRQRVVLRAPAALLLLSAGPNPAAALAFGVGRDLPLRRPSVPRGQSRKEPWA